MLSIWLGDVTGRGFMWYPGVEVEANHFGVQGSSVQLFGVPPCSSSELELPIEVSTSVPPGTEVRLTARVTWLDGPCEGTAEQRLSFTVR